MYTYFLERNYVVLYSYYISYKFFHTKFRITFSKCLDCLKNTKISIKPQISIFYFECFVLILHLYFGVSGMGHTKIWMLRDIQSFPPYIELSYKIQRNYNLFVQVSALWLVLLIWFFTWKLDRCFVVLVFHLKLKLRF